MEENILNSFKEQYQEMRQKQADNYSKGLPNIDNKTYLDNFHNGISYRYVYEMMQKPLFTPKKIASSLNALVRDINYIIKEIKKYEKINLKNTL